MQISVSVVSRTYLGRRNTPGHAGVDSAKLALRARGYLLMLQLGGLPQ
ncbi:MAG: hypothetical protein QOD59_5481 [Mycobacterium sp.]|jgi:hypothetical protein|nr:hypothetical protein [Mycobacterium sp.]